MGGLLGFDLLNGVCIAAIKSSDVDLLASRIINLGHKTYPHDVLHIFYRRHIWRGCSQLKIAKR